MSSALGWVGRATVTLFDVLVARETAAWFTRKFELRLRIKDFISDLNNSVNVQILAWAIALALDLYGHEDAH